jgi:hypothetical protein
MWNWHRVGRTLGYQSQTTGIRNLRTKDYLAQEIHLPSESAQSSFADAVEATTALARSASRQADSLQVLRRAMLGALLSGERAIPESYDALLDAP